MKKIVAFVLCVVVVFSLLPMFAFATTGKTKLKITGQPVNARVELGQKATVTVDATGDGLKYQWYVRDPGSESFEKSSIRDSVYSFALTKSKNGRELYCVVSDQYGNSVTSRTVNVSTPVTLKILKQPVTSYGEVGDTVKIKVSAQGDGLKYQWYVYEPGATKHTKSSVTTATYSWKVTKASSGTRIFCLLTDAYGNRKRTLVVALRVGTQLKIKEQPQNVGVAAGAVAKTSVKAEGEGLKYQWYLCNPGSNKFVKSSVKSDTYSATIKKGNSGRQVYCVITDAFGEKAKTDTVTLKIPTTLKITKQPADVLTKLGTLGTTSVKATGDGLRYVWYLKKPGETNYSKTTVTGNTYSFNMSKDDVGCRVFCLVSDMFGNKVRSNMVGFAAAKAEFDRSLYKVKPGEKRTVDLEIEPAGTKDEIIWSSSDTSIAKVNSKGVVTGVKNGTVTITARGKNTGFIASCSVKVCNVKRVAITFDDGPGKYTGELLDFLKENDIRVTFFLVGNRLSSYKSIVKRQVEEGHEIGYHSWKHDIQTTLSNSRIISDYEKSSKLLKSIAGAEFTLWRTPGGGKSDRVLNCIDLPHIMWSVDTLDWKYRETKRTWNVIKSYSKDNSIVLLHDIHKTTVKGAMKALEEMQKGDYEFVTVSELYEINGKTLKPSKTYYKG